MFALKYQIIDTVSPFMGFFYVQNFKSEKRQQLII